MAGEFVPAGVELIVKGLGQALSQISQFNKAVAGIGAQAGRAAIPAITSLGNSLKGIGSSAATISGSVGRSFQSIGASILSVGKTAAMVAVGGVAVLSAGLVALGALALSEFAKYERMALSIQALVARDIAQGKVVEEQRQVTRKLTEDEANEIKNLTQDIKDEELSRATLAARIKEQSESLRQLREAHGNEALDVQTATARLAEMENEYNKSGVAIQEMHTRIDELSGVEGQLVTVMEKVRTGQVDMNTAMEQAGPKAKELLGWITKLAVQSPFTEEGINLAFQTALAYGFTVDEAKKLTEAEVDYAAATGKSVDSTNLIALALGQMKAKGKVSGQEIIQLTNAGIGVNRILEDMGFTLDDVSNGLVDSDKFIQAVIDDMNIFEGAAADQATTFSGLISSLSDLKSIGLREFFAGTFTAIQPYLADFVGMLTSAALETGSIKEIGNTLGTIVAGGLQKAATFARNLYAGIQEVITAFKGFGARGAALSIATQLGITHDSIELFSKFKTFIGEIATTLSDTFAPALDSLASAGTMESINNAISFINDNFESFKGALIGIGAVLAGGLFVALGASLIALITPVNLIIAGVALLGAAWYGNWFGIKDATMAAWAAIQPVLTDLWTWIGNTLPPLMQVYADTWTNVLYPAMLQVGDWIRTVLVPVLADLGTWLNNNLTVAIQTLSDFWTTTLLPAMVPVGDWFTNVFMPILQDLYKWLAENIPVALQEAADFWTTTLQPAIVTVGDYISNNILPLLESIGKVFNATINKALEASAGLWQNVLLPALKEVGNTLLENLQPALDYIVPLLTSLGTTVSEDVEPGMQKMAEDILPAFQEGMDYVTEAIKKAISYFNSLAEAVSSFELPPILTPGSPPPMAYALMDIASSATDAGAAIKGMMLSASMAARGNGMDNLFGDMLNFGDEGHMKSRGFSDTKARNIKAAYRSALTELWDELAAGTATAGDLEALTKMNAGNWAQFVDGADIAFQTVTDNIKANGAKVAAELKDKLNESLMTFGQSFASFGDFLATRAQEAKQQTQDILDSMADLGEVNVDLAADNDKLTETIDTQRQKLGILRQELAELLNAEERDSIAIEKKRMAITELNAKIAENRQAMKANRQEMIANEKAMAASRKALEQLAFKEGLEGDEARIKLLDEFLKGKDQELKLDKAGLASGSSWSLIYNRLDAQEELNRLLKEQQEREEAIAKLEKAKADMEFLRQQMELAKMGRDLGIDVFKGMKVGLGLSVHDMLKASSDIVQAMVKQMDDDLQLGSPSRLSKKKFMQFMQGAVIGINKSKGMLMKSLGGAIAPFANIGDYILPKMQPGNSWTTNHNLYVSALTSPQAVINQFEVSKSLLGT